MAKTGVIRQKDANKVFNQALKSAAKDPLPPVPEALKGDVIAEIAEQDPEQMLKGMSDEQIEDLARQAFGYFARQNDNPAGFEFFYRVLFGREMPPFAKEWVERVYADHAAGKGSAIEAFRGSTKTTTVTIAFTAFRIGHKPEAANLLIQVGDEIANDNTAAVAEIIKNNPGWKLTFPNVVPDEQKGWGAGGYEVKRSDLPYEEWSAKNAARKDPTLIGLGYSSGSIIGKHPDGVLIVDDIHDEGNTSSEKELRKVLKILTDTIFPTVTDTTWNIFIGTPWTKTDALAYVEATGEYGVCKTPVYSRAEQGEEGAVEFERQYVKLAWPERFSLDELGKRKRLAGLGFARMYLLNLDAVSNQVFTYHSYPHERINTAQWVGGSGVDYAATHEMFISREGKRDLFAMAYGFVIPGGGLVVFDGVVAHCSQGEAEIFVQRAQDMFPNWRAACIEGDGRGEDFIAMVMRNPGIRVVGKKTGGKGKEQRLVKQLGPWLQSGRIRISDAETPFLNALRAQLNDYPLVEHDDCLDALYWLARLFPDVLVLPPAEVDELPQTRPVKKKNPYASLGG